jgi:hypothetical protein
MGAGSAKAHEAYSVAPATALPHPASANAGGPAATQGNAGAAPAAAEHELEVQLSAGPEPAGVDLGGADDVADEPVGMPGPDPEPEASPLWEDAATPVPATAPAGEVNGVPLLVGGADLEDSLATLVAYQGPGGVREVLHATVAEEAEGKLLEAVSVSEGKLVPVVVDKTIDGRLPADSDHQLYEQLEALAKSVNHHLKAGDAIPAHTLANYEKVTATLQELKAAGVTPAEAAMLEQYQAAADAIGQRIKDPGATPYDAGGKIPHVSPHEVSQLVSVTEYVPAPAGQVPEGLHAGQLRTATRLSPTLDSAGIASWDGTARAAASGKEYRVDLGDGYSAVYRPYAAAGAAPVDFSQRGALEIVAPPGAGHGPELVAKLGELNLVNRPLTKAEGEWAYLQRNIWAQQLDYHKAVGAALAEAAGLDDAVTELLVAQRKHQAIGMGDTELNRFARELRLEAEARALPHKVALVRDAVAKATGWASGAELAASPGYDPTPRESGGWLTWDRFDVAGNAGAVDQAFAGKGLTHRLTGHNLVDVLSTGVLASTERRRLMGIKPGKGMSEGSDMKTGGAKSVFLRVASGPGGGPSLYWSKASTLLRRSDWYAYGSDHFGSLNPSSGHSTSGQSRNPATVAGFQGSNEVMFRHGIDLLGAEAPTKIVCGSVTERTKVLTMFKARGVEKLGGKKVEEVVQ